MVEREFIIESSASILVVLLFVGSLLAIGSTYYDDTLSETGGIAVIATIVGFILVMGVMGYWLSGRDE